MSVEIDYSDIPEVQVAKSQNKWVPPRHVYFGPKDADGSPLPEPVYEHQEYPRAMYIRAGEKLKAGIAKDETQCREMMEKGYKKSLADFGIITAPSFDQAKAMREAQEIAEMEAEPTSSIDEQKPRRGRPPLNKSE